MLYGVVNNFQSRLGIVDNSGSAKSVQVTALLLAHIKVGQHLVEDGIDALLNKRSLRRLARCHRQLVQLDLTLPQPCQVRVKVSRLPAWLLKFRLTKD